MPAKLVVTARKGGSRISLLGSSGKELLASTVFTEPRAKGATLRALKGLLGDVTIEDHTLSGPGRTKDTDAAPVAPRSAPAKAERPAKAGAKKVAATTKATKAVKAVKTAAVKAASAPAATEGAVKAAAKGRTASKKAAAPARRGTKKAAVAAAPVAKTPAARRQAAARVASNSTTARV